MSRDLSLIPSELDRLHSDLATPDVDASELFLRLRGLQRMGVSRLDLRVHVERRRAVAEVLGSSAPTEENCLTALDIIEGVAGPVSLHWDVAEMARVALPHVLSRGEVEAAVRPALQPNDLLPPRPIGDLDDAEVRRFATMLLDQLGRYEIVPARADLFRVPRSGFTSRPAALLAPADRVIYEALGEPLSDVMERVLSPEVIWPRSHASERRYESFARAPEQWPLEYVVLTDVANFYESVDHAVLVSLMTRRLRVDGQYLTAVESFLDAVMGAGAGLPQGPPASELFATVYLEPVDSLLRDQGWLFCRYADDYRIGATSVDDGRRKLEQLEAVMREMRLTLNVSKTKVLKKATYTDALGKPSKRVERLRQNVRDRVEAQLLETEDHDFVEEVLRDVGVEDDTLWNLLYHGTTGIDEVVESIRDRLIPPLLDAYADYFVQVTGDIAAGDVPEDLGATERDLKECLAFLATSSRQVGLPSIQTALEWFPRLAPEVSAFLVAVAPAEDGVEDFLIAWLDDRGRSDWLLAWICHVAEISPNLVGPRLFGTLRTLALESEAGWLSRTGAVRALANAGLLDEHVWLTVLEAATPAVRAELVMARWAEPSKYPFGPAAIGPTLLE